MVLKAFSELCIRRKYQVGKIMGAARNRCVSLTNAWLSRVLKLMSSSERPWGLPRANLNNCDFHSSELVAYCYFKWICIYNIYVNFYYIHVCVLCVCTCGSQRKNGRGQFSPSTSGDWTQVIRPGSKWLYPLSNLPTLFLFVCCCFLFCFFFLLQPSMC